MTLASPSEIVRFTDVPQTTLGGAFNPLLPVLAHGDGTAASDVMYGCR